MLPPLAAHSLLQPDLTRAAATPPWSVSAPTADGEPILAFLAVFDRPARHAPPPVTDDAITPDSDAEAPADLAPNLTPLPADDTAMPSDPAPLPFWAAPAPRQAMDKGAGDHPARTPNPLGMGTEPMSKVTEKAENLPAPDISLDTGSGPLDNGLSTAATAQPNRPAGSPFPLPVDRPTIPPAATDRPPTAQTWPMPPVDSLGMRRALGPASPPVLPTPHSAALTDTASATPSAGADTAATRMQPRFVPSPLQQVMSAVPNPESLTVPTPLSIMPADIRIGATAPPSLAQTAAPIATPPLYPHAVIPPGRTEPAPAQRAPMQPGIAPPPTQGAIPHITTAGFPAPILPTDRPQTAPGLDVMTSAQGPDQPELPASIAPQTAPKRLAGLPDPARAAPEEQQAYPRPAAPHAPPAFIPEPATPPVPGIAVPQAEPPVGTPSAIEDRGRATIPAKAAPQTTSLPHAAIRQGPPRQPIQDGLPVQSAPLALRPAPNDPSPLARDNPPDPRFPSTDGSPLPPSSRATSPEPASLAMSSGRHMPDPADPATGQPLLPPRPIGLGDGPQGLTARPTIPASDSIGARPLGQMPALSAAAPPTTGAAQVAAPPPPAPAATMTSEMHPPDPGDRTADVALPKPPLPLPPFLMDLPLAPSPRIDGGGGQPATNQTTPTALPDLVARQILPHVSTPGAVSVILTPIDLGTLRFEVTQKGDALHLHLTVDLPATLDLLRRQGDQMIAELRQAGFANASLSFAANDGQSGNTPSGQGQPGEDGRNPRMANPPPPLPSSPPPEAASAPLHSQRAPSGTLDLRL